MLSQSRLVRRLGFSPKLALLLILAACASGSASQSKKTPPPALDLRARILEFHRGFKEKLWTYEDLFISQERPFVDRMRMGLREAENKITESIATSPDWKKAKRDAREAMRKTQQDFRQQVRIQRENFELDLMRFYRDRELELRKWHDDLVIEIRGYKDEPGYSVATSDLSEAKSELQSTLSDFKTRIKNLKPKENFWE